MPGILPAHCFRCRRRLALGGCSRFRSRGHRSACGACQVRHRAASGIDGYTDIHAEIRTLRACFEPPYRRYAGILIDIWFDHLLARDFAAWSDIPLQRFSDDLVQLLHRHDALLPESLRRFRAYLQAHQLPAAYADRQMIGEVLVGVGTRLKRANPLAQGLIEISAWKWSWISPLRLLRI